MIVTRKLLIPTLTFIAVMFLGFITINAFNTRADIEASEEQNLEDKLDIFQERLESRESFAVGLALEVANNPEVQAAFAAGDRERLTELTLPSYLLIDEQFDVPQHQFHLPPATSFLRLHSLDQFDDDLSSFRATVLAANAEQRPVSGTEIGRGGLGIRGVVPVSYENEHIGTVEFGLNIDQPLLNSLKDQIDADLQLMLLKEPAEVATFAGATADVQGPTDDLILQASTLEAPIFGDATIYPGVLEGTPVISRISVDDLQYAIISAPVFDFSGQVIGVVEIFNDRTAVVANERQNVVTAVVAALITISLGGVGLAIIMTRMLRPIGTLTETAVAIAEGDLNRVVGVTTKDEIGTLATSFNNMTSQLRNLIGSLEERVSARTRDLNLAAEIGQQVSQVRHLDQLLPQAVQLVLERFDLYQAQIYLVDEAGEQLVLKASTGHAGTQLLEAGHTLPIDENSLNGTAVTTKQAVIVADTAKSPAFHPNPLLPDTRSEMVVPLLMADKVVGVLDLQSDKPNALAEDNLPAFETLSGQLAIAIHNAALLNERRQVEAQVREREALMRTIIDATPDWIFAKDMDHRYILLNKAFADTLQLSPDEVIGKHDLEIGVPEDIVMGDTEKGISGIWPGERAVMESGQTKIIEEAAYTPDGKPVALTAVRAPLRDAEGNVSGMVGFIHDITDLKQAEANIRRRETLLRTIIDSTPDWIFVKDVDHRYLLVNQGYANSFHLKPEEFIGKNDLDIGFPEEIVKGDPEKGIRGFWADDREIMEQGELKVIDVEPAVIDGENRWLNTVKAPLKDTAGNVTGIVGFVHDITEQKHIEEVLRHNETELSQAMNIAKLAYWEFDVANDLFTFNDQFYALFHTTAEEHGGYQLSSAYYAEHFVYPDDLPMVGGEIERALNSTDLHYRNSVEHRILYADGGVGYILVNIRLDRDEDGNILRFSGANQDITERKQAEETLAKRAVELQIIANVSAVTAAILEPDELLQQVVELTKERFNLYHAHIYLLDEGKTELILTNGAGEVGQKMVAEGRRIAVDQEKSLVARAARGQKGVVINDVQADPGFLRHMLLPDTKAEMAVPLIVGNEVLGVLDVQADSVNRFMTEDVNIFTTLASQIAISLQNARSLKQSEQAVRGLQELSQRLTREGWETYLAERADKLTFSYDRTQKTSSSPVDADTPVSSQGANLLTQTLQIQGEPIGKLLLEAPKQYGEDESQLLTAVSERLSAHLENLRLAEASERDRAAAERRSQEMAVINNIVTQISTSLDLQHSLQIVVDELVTAVNVDQVRVALIQPDKKELLVIAEHYDMLRATSAVGMTIPIEGNALTQKVIETRQMVIVEDAQNNPQTAPVQDLFREQGIQTVVLMPLVVNDEVIGTLGMDILDDRPVTVDGLKLAETIVFQTATAIQNARLFEQIQATLAETEMLYSYSSQLNTATSLDAVLDSAAAAGFQVGATDAVLLVYDRNTTGNPEYAQVAATAPRNEKRVGERLYLQEQPTRYLWPASGQNTVFVGNVSEDARLSPEDKASFAQQGLEALAIMYLNVGNLRLGQIIIHWNKAQTFTSTDERLYGAIAQQASSVVYNRLLFNQTEEALSETAALYQASSDLNTAQTFDEVLTALRQHTILGQGTHNVTISFFDRPWDKDDLPEEVHVLAEWGITNVDDRPTRFKVDAFPGFLDLLDQEELQVHEDVANDKRISKEGRVGFVEYFNTHAIVYAPLIVGSRRLGFINGYYPKPMSFTEEQLRRLNVLVRQAAITIQSIRLYEQTQEALAQTEALYTGSERIVLASTEDDILQSLIQSTELRRLDRASIFMFDHPVEDRVPGDVTVVATWVNEGVPPSVQVGTRFEVARVPFLSTVTPDESFVINDIRTDPRVDGQTRQILEGYGMISFVMVPVIVGSQWLGMVSGQSSVPMNMTEVQMRQANSLVGQAAVVMQTTILFRQEQARAHREHLLREIAAKVRNSTDIDTIMQTAVTEIGRTLGRRSFIKLGNGKNGNAQADEDQLSQSQKEKKMEHHDEPG